MNQNKEQILAAIKKLGPSSPTAIANSTGIEPANVGYHLRGLKKAGAVTATGSTASRLYSIASGKGASRDAPPQKRKKRGKASRAKPAAAERFIPAVDAENRLVLVNGSDPLHFTAAQTEAIAACMFHHFDA